MPAPQGANPQHLFRYLDIQGTGSGRKNANVLVGELGNATFDFTGGAAEDQWTLASHTLETGDRVRFTAKGTGATGFDTGVDYYVIYLTANTFKLATSLANAVAGTPIEGVDDSVGTWTIERYDTDHFIQAPAGYDYEIERLIVTIYDTTAMQAQEYGNLGSALNGGITVHHFDANGVEVTEYTDGVPITINAGWAYLASVDVNVMAWGAGNELLVVRWTLGKSGAPLLLLPGEKFVVRLAWNATDDDYSGLLSHYFQAQGVQHPY